MKINTNKVIEKRKSKAWSQQHLAQVSGLSLRTIQRVEKNGSGSLETVKSLASCFELDVQTLFEPDNEKVKYNSKSKLAIVCSLVVAVACSVLFMVPTSAAEDITITAETVEKNAKDGNVTYRENVEIFFSEGIPYDVLIDSNWQRNTSSLKNSSVKVYLESTTIFIEKGAIKKVENGTRITTDYAQASKS